MRVVDRYQNGNEWSCNPDTRDCDNCRFKDDCLINLIITASKVGDLHTTDGKIIRNGELIDE